MGARRPKAKRPADNPNELPVRELPYLDEDDAEFYVDYLHRGVHVRRPNRPEPYRAFTIGPYDSHQEDFLLRHGFRWGATTVEETNRRIDAALDAAGSPRKARRCACAPGRR
jgi:hypothetical protein